MSASLSRYLKDFSAPKVELSMMAPRYFSDLDPFSHTSDDVEPSQPPVDLEAERSTAFEQGRQEAAAELAFEHAQQLAELKAAHAAEIDAMRERCDAEIAGAIAARFAEMADRLSVAIGDQTARVLAPILDEVLVRKAVEDMARMIRQGFGSGDAGLVTVTGPDALFEMLKQNLKDDDRAFRHVSSTDIDLTVEIGDAILVTRMSAWADTVRKVLA